ncbi:MAG TPA: AraC family transcriptional regulator [Pedobacter sp.]
MRNIPDLLPVTRDYYENWTIKVFNRETNACNNYLSPNRRDFYKILFITQGTGVFTLGTNTYYIEEPTILFLHPNEIISWKNLANESAGHFCLFKKRFLDGHLILKSVSENYSLFSDVSKSVIRLTPKSVTAIDRLFKQMHEEETIGGPMAEDALQAYMQLIMVESARVANYPVPDTINSDFRHVHEFFNLLEKEASGINYTNPVRIKTAKEFADQLAIHPNHLNALLKKHTGQNVSTHIKSRLLEESKVLLLQTDWTLQDIGFSIGFAEQPNFSQFFKKHIGITPAEFRRSYHS